MFSMIFGLKRRIFLKLLLFAIFLATPIIGLAATYYVSPTGSDSNSGTLASPWKTLAKAVSSVSSGDTVYLRAGTWNEKLWFSNKNYTSYVTFQNYPGESPTLDGTGLTLQYEEGIVQALNRSYIRVRGLRILNSPDVGMDKPVSMRMVVVLPAPLGPRKPKTSPWFTPKLIPSTASTPPSGSPYTLVSSLTSIA